MEPVPLGIEKQRAPLSAEPRNGVLLGFAAARTAMLVTAPLRIDLSHWQVRLGNLSALLESCVVDQVDCVEADELIDAVERARLHFDDTLDALPADICRSTRVIETRVALGRVLEVAHQLRLDLEAALLS